MPSTHLPAHMDSVRQKCRPKHQLLVLKCYPRLPKNSAADVKPNSSELSYLLYYASTRRSKLHKVGAFLERKTASDVWRWQSARVLVTLQILTALLEHKVIGHANGFALIAPSVLRIIREIINNTNDASLIEGTVSTWETLCERQESAALAGDAEYRDLYEQVVRLYSNLAKKGNKKLAKSTQPIPYPDAIRLRKAGLSALTCVFTPTELASWWNRQFELAVPAISSNLRSDDPNYINYINSLSARSEEEEKTRNVNRRQSLATVRTVSGLWDAPAEPDPRAAEGTAQDADRLEEEAVAVLALDCLKTVFQSQNRAQIRGGALAFLHYVFEEEQRAFPRSSDPPIISPSSLTNWVTRLYRLITSWTPMQERFILIVTAVETLAKETVNGSTLHFQLLYANLIDDILRSDLNLIGLSVMDVLLTLTAHIQRVISAGAPVVFGDDRSQVTSLPEKPMAQALLVQRLKDCISDLATHVYYSDQITDMISAILLRIRAPPSTVTDPSPPGVASSDEHKVSVTDPNPPGVVSSDEREVSVTDPNPLGVPSSDERKVSFNDTASNLSRLPTQDLPSSSEEPHSSSGYFASEAARQVALETVKDILDVAKSSRQYLAGSGSKLANRNPVPMSVWRGTHWLLRDAAEAVRQAYIDALTTWARVESEAKDASVIDFDNLDDPLARLADASADPGPAGSLRGSIGQPSHASQARQQPHLLAAPHALAHAIFAEGRRLSSGRNSSSAGGGGPGGDRSKPRVRVEDLKQILDGRTQVQIHVGTTAAAATPHRTPPVDVARLLDGIHLDDGLAARKPTLAQPPY